MDGWISKWTDHICDCQQLAGKKTGTGPPRACLMWWTGIFTGKECKDLGLQFIKNFSEEKGSYLQAAGGNWLEML